MRFTDLLFDALSRCAELSRSFTLSIGSFGSVPYEYASLHDRLTVLSRPHLPRLVEMRRDFLLSDEFGVQQRDKWALELGYFINEAVLPYLGPYTPFAQRRLLYLAGCLEDLIAQAEKLDRLRGMLNPRNFKPTPAPSA